MAFDWGLCIQQFASSGAVSQDRGAPPASTKTAGLANGKQSVKPLCWFVRDFMLSLDVSNPQASLGHQNVVGMQASARHRAFPTF
jgi:hypothetical protein